MSALPPTPDGGAEQSGHAGPDDEADGHGEFERSVVGEHPLSVEPTSRDWLHIIFITDVHNDGVDGRLTP